MKREAFEATEDPSGDNFNGLGFCSSSFFLIASN
jgi:hypothetical protein